MKNDYHLNINKDYFCGYVIPNNKLHLDFYFPKLNLAIEYDGIQHYTPIEFFGGEKALMEQKDRDKQKDKYCKNHNIKLIRIPYTNHTYKEIKEVLDSNLSGFM